MTYLQRSRSRRQWFAGATPNRLGARKFLGAPILRLTLPATGMPSPIEAQPVPSPAKTPSTARSPSPWPDHVLPAVSASRNGPIRSTNSAPGREQPVGLCGQRSGLGPGRVVDGYPFCAATVGMRLVGGVLVAVMPVVMGEGLKPLTIR